MQDFIDTSKFDKLIDAVKDLYGFNTESRLDIGIPSLALKLKSRLDIRISSLALKLGHSLKRCAHVPRSSTLRSKDEASIKQAKRFLGLFEAEWTNEIRSRSLASLGSKKPNIMEYLLLAEDLTVLTSITRLSM